MSSASVPDDGPDLYEPTPPLPALRVDVYAAACRGDLCRRCAALLSRGDDWSRALAVGYYARRSGYDADALAEAPLDCLPPDAAQIRLYALALTTAQRERLARLALCRVEGALVAGDEGRPDEADAIRGEVRSVRLLLAAGGDDPLDVIAY